MNYLLGLFDGVIIALLMYKLNKVVAAVNALHIAPPNSLYELGYARFCFRCYQQMAVVGYKHISVNGTVPIGSRFLVHAGVNLVNDARDERRLWQKRFWEHTIHVNYVHINPEKHGHVGRVIDWPHSTLHRYIKQGLLAADWACASPEGTFGE